MLPGGENRAVRQAFFGQPQKAFVPGGAHIAAYVVPVFEGRLVVFDVAAEQARGRWLPWDVLEFGGNPYETAAALVDEWCGGAVESLELVDALSLPFGAGGWEMALVYRAGLTEMPAGDADRQPYAYPEGAFDAIGSFDPVDLERWVRTDGPPPDAAITESTRDGDPLVF